MYRFILRIILGVSLLICVGEVKAQLTYNKELYGLKTYGNEKANVRMFSDYVEIGGDSEFYVVFYFEVSPSWFVYTEKASTLHRPLSISLKLPAGVEIVKKKSDKGVIRPNGEMYEKDFCIIYRLRCFTVLKENVEIGANIGWQCCNGMLCTGGDVALSLTLLKGKDRKSGFYKDIHRLWDEK